MGTVGLIDKRGSEKSGLLRFRVQFSSPIGASSTRREENMFTILLEGETKGLPSAR